MYIYMYIYMYIHIYIQGDLRICQTGLHSEDLNKFNDCIKHIGLIGGIETGPESATHLVTTKNIKGTLKVRTLLTNIYICENINVYM
jgi:hypothetical protein